MHVNLYRISILLAMIVAGLPARAQIEISSDHDHRVYLQFEPVEYRTVLTSKSGRPQVINAGDGPVFYFNVRDDYGNQIAPVGAHEPVDPLMVAAQGRVVITNYMNRVFPMSEPGEYSIQPCVEWLGKVYTGEKRFIEIVRGREISRLSAIVPTDNTRRTYMIYHVNRDQQDHILLRIDDEDAGASYGVYSLGRSVLNESPQMATDADGNVHVLLQSAPRTYLHAVYTPFGKLAGSEFFGRDYSSVSLESKPNGTIAAVGQKTGDKEPAVIESILEDR